jgi:coenzyme F420-0:L-glutamate ligase/coenzyme F420-1:gamma-L-glutamate ligase
MVMGAKENHPASAATPGRWLREFLAGRRSIRRYLDLPVARELVDSLLDAATAAASAHNRQPWRFLVIEAASTKQQLALAMGDRLRSDRLGDGDLPPAIEADVSRSYARLTGAPVLVVVCMTMADMDCYADDRRSRAERLMAVQGTAMAAQNLLLAAHAVGLGACWMCAPLFCADTVACVLALPRDWEPQAIITLGHPAARGKAFHRRSLSEVARYPDREP